MHGFYKVCMRQSWETKGKLAGRSLLYANVNKGNINKGKELLVGLGVGDNNNCIQVEDSSAHRCGCVAYGGVAMAACWVFIIIVWDRALKQWHQPYIIHSWTGSMYWVCKNKNIIFNNIVRQYRASAINFKRPCLNSTPVYKILPPDFCYHPFTFIIEFRETFISLVTHTKPLFLSTSY